MHSAIACTNKAATVDDVVKLAISAKNTVFTDLHAKLKIQHDHVQRNIKKIVTRCKPKIGKQLHLLLRGKYTIKSKTNSIFKIRKKKFKTNNVALVKAYQDLITFVPQMQHNSSDSSKSIDAQAAHLVSIIAVLQKQ